MRRVKGCILPLWSPGVPEERMPFHARKAPPPGGGGLSFKPIVSLSRNRAYEGAVPLVLLADEVRRIYDADQVFPRGVIRHPEPDQL